MPREQMTDKQVSAYLQMDLREVQKLASRGVIPCRKSGQRLVFVKGEIDHWVEQRLHEMDRRRLRDIGRGVSAHHGFDHETLLAAPMIPIGGIAVPMHARTRESVLRHLVGLAGELIYNADHVLAEIRAREEICSTAMIPGVALPHPRHPLEYDIAESFVTVGLTHSGVPFGAVDGSLTRLYFLICCKDERTHLHVLARLSAMLHDGKFVQDLLECPDSDTMRAMLLEREEVVLSGA
ncbi:MAG: PTS sugar transporter subunit IIA [Planctomycetaceae bacterium]|nr:PTS sugar transporter subunit IIA [Planctomycetaceae bacterium]